MAIEEKKVNSKITVVMPYIGGILTDNSYQYLTKKVKPFINMWKRELAGKVEIEGITKASSYNITVSGYFTNNVRPDIANLFKVIGDALKAPKGPLPVDDKYFRFFDGGYELGYMDPELVICIESVQENM